MSGLEAIIMELNGIVASENKQLRRGIYTELSETVERKQSLMVQLDRIANADINKSEKDRHIRDFETLAELLRENDLLMKSAINSVKLAYKQIGIIRNTEKKVGAYNRFGHAMYIQDMPGLKTKLV